MGRVSHLFLDSQPRTERCGSRRKAIMISSIATGGNIFRRRRCIDNEVRWRQCWVVGPENGAVGYVSPSSTARYSREAMRLHSGRARRHAGYIATNGSALGLWWLLFPRIPKLCGRPSCFSEGTAHLSYEVRKRI